MKQKVAFVFFILNVAINSTFSALVSKQRSENFEQNQIDEDFGIDFELKKAESCILEQCQLPDCRCSGLELPANEFKGKEKEIPQFITITFDDAVNTINFAQYEELFKDLINPDHCPAVGTFYVSHEYTDYSKVNALYSQGHEIALHSITHGDPDGVHYWQTATLDSMLQEFGQQIQMLERFAKVEPKHIKGLRLPFLQMNGNSSFAAAKHLGLLYDSSMPTEHFKDPPMWPYTFDYLTVQECQIGACPNAAIEGLWEYPMVAWTDMKNISCAMVDACIYPPPDTLDDVYNWILKHFNRHYETNRAPFGFFVHSAWFDRGINNFDALRKFLVHVNSLPDVYITTSSRVIQYMKHPTLGKPFQGCHKKPTTSCTPVSCKLSKDSDGQTRYLTVCDKCPEAYPWLGNPLGLRQTKLKM